MAEATPLLTIAKYRDRFAPQSLTNKCREDHAVLPSLAWSDRIEEPDDCDINATGTQCGGQGDCFYLDGGSCTSDSDCEEGYSCDTVGFDRICHADICLVTCNPSAAEPCPRGYQCGDVSGLGDYYCFADCVWLRNEGYL